MTHFLLYLHTRQEWGGWGKGLTAARPELGPAIGLLPSMGSLERLKKKNLIALLADPNSMALNRSNDGNFSSQP